MKVTMIRKLNTIISLWLLAIIIALGFMGYKLDIFGFYIACAVIATVLLASNVFSLTVGILSTSKKALGTEPEYNK